jgi:hypothetical protein
MDDAATTQLLHLYTAYARAHPDKLTLPAAALAYNAMRDKFPCEENKTGE